MFQKVTETKNMDHDLDSMQGLGFDYSQSEILSCAFSHASHFTLWAVVVVGIGILSAVIFELKRRK